MDVFLILLPVLLLIFIVFVISIKKAPSVIINDAILNHEELKSHAVYTAKIHKITYKNIRTNILAKRLKDNYNYILKVYSIQNELSKKNTALCPGSEWLLDNFYIIEEEIKSIQQSFNKKSFKDLPVLKDEYLKKYPRVFFVALELVSHTDGRIDKDLLSDFLNNYQSINTLSISEIWSMQIMVKIALVEKIRFICEKINTTQSEWEEAESLKNLDSEKILNILKKKFEDKNHLSPAYIEHLMAVLRKQEINHDEIINYTNSRLLEIDSSIEKIVHIEHQELASQEISIGNCISSLRLISSWDWKELFENLSSVEKILIQDPSNIYIYQDFETKNHYRKELQKLSKKYGVSETYAALKSLECAKKNAEDNSGYPSNHVGYYIYGRGKHILVNKITGKKQKENFTPPLFYYIYPILILSFLISYFLSLYIYNVEGKTVYAVLTFIFAFIPAADVSISIINNIALKITPPDFLPKLELKDGIPSNCASIIIFPTVLPDDKRLEELLYQLEITYLSNREKNLYFAIVGDFKDDNDKFNAADGEIIEKGLEIIKKLNNKYAENEDIFYLFIRERKYNESNSKWMGWEKKRGAIIEFNNLIRGLSNTSFTTVSGSIAPLLKVKYVITLDADTVLPIGEAKQLVGTISHPLNAAHYDKNKGIVTEGYGIIQPRVSISLISSNKTLFARIFGGEGGIDTYSAAISDIYQDIFKEGIFTGKGIYDVDIFRTCLNESIPENSILSHDLLEGCFVRAGLATDMEFIDSFPEKYGSYTQRLHRWVRGDWQLIRWLFPYVYNQNNERVKNPLTSLSRWKILDNLRRSMVPLKIALLIFFGTVFLSKGLLILLIFSIITLAMPVFLYILNYFYYKSFKLHKGKTHSKTISGVKASLYKFILDFIFLPHTSFLILDAVVRTIYRVFISKRKLLQWVTAAEAEKNTENNLKSYIINMKACFIYSIFLVMLTYFFSPQNLWYAAILSVLFSISPLAAYKISTPYENKKEILTPEDIKLIRRVGRKTWNFYEDFSTEEENYLPIDNFQLKPVEKVAHRTSPTNIGFLIMSTLCARDLGYITLSQAAERIKNTLSTIDKLEKWNGHLYNWYDTRNLSILRPKYISTVDSGNFAAYLITAAMSFKEYISTPMLRMKDVLGLEDTIGICSKHNKDDKLKWVKQEKKLNSYDWYEFLLYLNGTIKVSSKDDKRLVDMISSQINELTNYFPKIMWDRKENDLFKGLPQFKAIREGLNSIASNPSPIYMSKAYKEIICKIDELLSEEQNIYLISLKNNIIKCLNNVDVLIEDIKELCERMESIVKNTNFSVLYDSKRNLFSIGYNIDADRLTNSYYDLLASEARITSFIAASFREIPPSHWFKLGRSIVLIDGYESLVSWSGTMFEYFMPALVMKNFHGTLLDETYKTVIESQMKYGKMRGLPWGTSESGYYTFDLLLNYQYKAFGVPDLGLKRGLINDMVVSPYSVMLALPFSPENSIENLKSLSQFGIEGKYGFYEAIDFTPERLTYDNNYALVESFMAHHQGMILSSINNFINDDILVKRFHSYPQIKAGELMLQEKIPSRILITKEHKETVEPFIKPNNLPVSITRRCGMNLSFPVCHILSNGKYNILLTNSGTGYSREEDVDISRWKSQSPCGTFFLFRNVESMKIWSASYEPLKIKPDFYEVKFSQDKAEFKRKDEFIETDMEICVSPEDDCEIRKITLINHGDSDALVECTSFIETALIEHKADTAHPAFNNLFIMTEKVDDYNALLAWRRKRSIDSEEIYCFHSLTVAGETAGAIEYETDRFKFIGRGRDIQNPEILNKPLTQTTGAVLDPVLSLRQTVKIAQNKSAVLIFTTGTASSKEKALAMAAKYSDMSNIVRTYELAYIRSQMEIKYLNLSSNEIEQFDSIIPHILFISPTKKKYEKYIIENKNGQPNLWAFGISGDLPILLVTIRDCDSIDTVKLMIKAYEYFKIKGLKIDLVILDEEEGGYLQPLQDLIKDAVLSSNARDVLNSYGGIYIKNISSMSKEDITLLYACANLIIKADVGSIISQLKYKEASFEFKYEENLNSNIVCNYDDLPVNLEYFNGYGGFDIDEQTYVIRLNEYNNTPMPWSNIIGNENFGTLVTELGFGYTWSENSRENKLTPWSNDPVSDPQGEVIYIMDPETQNLISVTPSPIRDSGLYTIKHGLGYSKYIHSALNISYEGTVFVPLDDNIKITLLKLKNLTNTSRKLYLYYYINPALGVHREVSTHHIVTEFNKESDTILALNSYNTDFLGRAAFVSSGQNISEFTCDEDEFIGINRSLKNPRGIRENKLLNRCGGGLNPCIAVKILVDLKENEEKEIVFLLGQGKDKDDALSLAQKYKNIYECKAAFEKVSNYWKNEFNKVIVNTPDKSMDIMLNSNLLYQSLVCRVWARTAFYQCGGAFGFRDQLQDVISLLYSNPEIARKQILVHAQHQFCEGDVQHWWHPGCSDKGIRTKFSDDLLWLPYTVFEYIDKTGDFGILNESACYLEDSPLGDGENERYGAAKRSDKCSSIYVHCTKAIDYALKFGEHGIPLMGSGDWNDGMNTVGNKGKGESIWLGWFLYDILNKFTNICEKLNDKDHADAYAENAEKIKDSIEKYGWDGKWYLRAYFDDGTPLGSSSNSECMIDSISQTWSILSKGGSEERVKLSMKAVEDYLIKKDDGMILLFTPPFDKGDLNPGYIKGYLPGVRENGGQYTHAAAWVIYALCLLKQEEKAYEFFSLINPINHARTPMECARYKVEPYVMAADIYYANSHVGRGGWTWYTGSASWVYRAGLEGILGFKKHGDTLTIEPCVPKSWHGYTIDYTYKSSKYHIEVVRESSCDNITLQTFVDDMLMPDNIIHLNDDNLTHNVKIII